MAHDIRELVGQVADATLSPSEAATLCDPDMLRNFSCYAGGVHDPREVAAYWHILGTVDQIPPTAVGTAAPVLHCRRCGAMGTDGQSPFTTHATSGLCDDCA